jgi:hypothetical protein
VLKKLKKLKEKYGSAQVCVWLGLKDTRTLNTWLSRDSIPSYMEEIVKQVITERS